MNVMGLREQKKEETRRILLEKAGALFAAKGYQRVTTSQIARLAGIAEGTLFNYYKTKGELFIAAMMPEPSAGASWNVILDDIDPRSLAAAITAQLDREWSPLANIDKAILQDYFSIVYGGGLTEGGEARTGLFALDERVIEQIVDFLRLQRKEHPAKLAKLDAELAASCIFGCAATLLSQYVLIDGMDYGQLKQALHAQIEFLLTGHIS